MKNAILPVFALFLVVIPLSCDKPLTEPEALTPEGPDFSKGKQVNPNNLPSIPMVFTSFRDGYSGIYWMELSDPGTTKALTTNQYSARDADWSPSGDQIVFSGDLRSPGDFDLYLMDVSPTGIPGTPTLLAGTPRLDSRPAWSPDGLRIAWQSRQGRPSDIYYIERSSLTGAWGTLQKLTDDPNTIDITPAWSPKGDQIIFDQSVPWGPDEQRYRDLVIVDLATGLQTRATDTPSIDEGYPAWLSGNEIAFSVLNEDPNSYIYVGKLGSLSTAVPVTTTAADVGAFWTAGGKQILFTSERDGNFEVYLMDRDGKNQINLTNNPADDLWGKLSPNTVSQPPILTRPEYEVISSGDYHTCALTALGEAYCWGWDIYGVLGLNNGTSPSPRPEKTEPTPVTGGHKFLSISAGAGHTCGLTIGNQVYCWGHHLVGELGDGSVPMHVQPVPQLAASGQSFKYLSVGHSHTCGITSDDETWCWGFNERLQLGRTTSPLPHAGPVPARIDVDPGFVTVSAGYKHTCGLTADGIAYCWGENGLGELGLGHRTGYDSGHSWWIEPQEIQGYRFKSLKAGGEFTCGITTLDETLCWGRNLYGELGSAPVSGPKPSPFAVDLSGSRGQHLTSITTGLIEFAGSHSCGLTNSGEAYCWGWDSWGEVGTGIAQPPPPSGVAKLPNAVSGSITFLALSAGFDHTCGLTTGGQIYCWGQQQHGRLGNGNDARVAVPTPVQVSNWPPIP